MNFWDHLDDLRRTLVKSLTAIAIAFAFAIFFYPSLFELLAPSNHVNGLSKADLHYERLANASDEPLSYTLTSRERLMEASSGVVFEYPTLYIPPEGNVLIEHTAPALYLLSPIEGFAAMIKVSIWTAFALSSPFWGYFLLQFLAPGLEVTEKRLIFAFLGLSLVFLSLGVLFAWQITLPIANTYLSAINARIGQNLWSATAYLDYTLLLLLANAIVFEMGLVLLFLVHLGVCTAPFMEQKRKGVIVAIFILSALLTPPDVLTQLLMAIPLMALYESAILYSRFRRNLLINSNI